MSGRGAGALERGEIEVSGIRRTYWLARAARQPGQAPPPLLIALHGRGMDGKGMAWFTGLGQRGPAAGLTAVFPDGWKNGWHPVRSPAQAPGLDDARFLADLASHLEGLGAASSWPVFLTGLSQGARFAEHVARLGLLPVTGLFLVAGTGLEYSRRLAPVPQLRAAMTLVIGTGDRTTPYAGGRLTRDGPFGLLRKRHAVRHGEQPGEDIVTGAEDLVADWARANGNTANGNTGNGRPAAPVSTELPMPSTDDPPVTRMTWAKPGCNPVTLYRIEGGGHGWPGGPQFLPARVIGPVSKHLDATGLLLEMAKGESAPAPGPPALHGD